MNGSQQTKWTVLYYYRCLSKAVLQHYLQSQLIGNAANFSFTEHYLFLHLSRHHFDTVVDGEL